MAILPHIKVRTPVWVQAAPADIQLQAAAFIFPDIKSGNTGIDLSCVVGRKVSHQLVGADHL
ncbi:hypothetical protein D3C86_2126520 [compost metagenome]